MMETALSASTVPSGAAVAHDADLALLSRSAGRHGAASHDALFDAHFARLAEAEAAPATASAGPAPADRLTRARQMARAGHITQPAASNRSATHEPRVP